MKENITAIIVDDEALGRESLKEALCRFEDIEVIRECANGFEAVQAVQQAKPDLLFLDIQMPKLDGFDVVELLGKEAPAIIFVTAYDEYALRAFEAEALERLASAAQPFGNDVASFLAALALQHDTDLFHPRAEKIALLTMHAAKGLEFPVVYIAGCEAGLLPFERPGEAVNVEEERRLFYVAMTRAGQRLFLSWARKRSRHGRQVECRPAPFLTDIEARLKESESQPRGRLKQAQLELF